MSKSLSCITDRPISGTSDSDALGNNKYANGLLSFLRNADTPITIGIQGGWGSGKTSLINLMQRALEDGGDSLCVFVNAWEHSLFHSDGDRSAVAVALLRGLVTEISDAIEERSESKTLPPNKQISREVKARALREATIGEKAGKFALGAALTIMRVGAKTSGIDLDVESGAALSKAQTPVGSEFIRSLRRDIQHAVAEVIKGSGYKRFVCFIDDLDRVHPKTAVEILDVVKNVFDIEGCIFILAIDYDVVVKGLTDKFGEKSKDNEREFRQYFDKIIQVPFSMPVAAYQKKTEALLEAFFSSLGHKGVELPFRDMAKVAWHATDGAPRSIKRIVNTLSLLNSINANSDATTETDPAASVVRFEILFIVVALQINFPEIFRKLTQRSDFTKWTMGSLQQAWALDPRLLTDAVKQQSAFDEEWEQVLYLVCCEQEWLKRKSSDISRILNRLKALTEDDAGERYLTDALNASKITEIESTESAFADGEGTRDDRVTKYFQFIHEEISKRLPALGLEAMGRRWAKGSGRKRYYGSKGDDGIDAKKSESVECLYIDLYEDQAELVLTMSVRTIHGRTKEFRLFLEESIKAIPGLPPVSNPLKDFFAISLPAPKSGSEYTQKHAIDVATTFVRFIVGMDALVKNFKGR